MLRFAIETFYSSTEVNFLQSFYFNKNFLVALTTWGSYTFMAYIRDLYFHFPYNLLNNNDNSQTFFLPNIGLLINLVFRKNHYLWPLLQPLHSGNNESLWRMRLASLKKLKTNFIRAIYNTLKDVQKASSLTRFCKVTCLSLQLYWK